MKKLFTIMLAFGALISLPSMAQQQKGDYQIQAQGSYFSQSGFSGGYIFLNASKFVTQNVEVGFSPNVFIATGATSLNLSFYGNYNFLTSDAKMVPYGGAQILIYGLGSDAGSSTGFGLKAGLRYFITEKVNVDVGPSITFMSGYTLFYFNAGLGFIISGN